MNHHGSVRKIGEEQEESDAKDMNVLKNNWVGEPHHTQLDLISRKEDVQVIINDCLRSLNSPCDLLVTPYKEEYVVP